MSLPVQLVPGIGEQVPGAEVEVRGDEAHHAVTVRRMRAGEHLVLTDGAGVRLLVEVTGTGNRSLQARVLEVGRTPRPRPDLTVVQALPKGDRGERAVEMLTEVGVATVVPWAATRSVAAWRGERARRSRAKWESTAREAAKQARRAWFPEVMELADTAQVLQLLSGADLAVVLHEDADRHLAATAVPRDGRVVVVVGPEGGLTSEEVEAFEGAGAVPVRMGAEVLRTSTAGVVAAGVLLSRTARWGLPDEPVGPGGTRGTVVP